MDAAFVGNPGSFGEALASQPDYRDALVGRSASLARRLYALVYPRDSWLGRVGTAFLNAQLWLSRSQFRVYVHRAADVDAILAAHGLVKRLHRTTLIWQLVLYERPAA